MASAIKRTFSRAKSPQPPKAIPAIGSILNTPSPPSTISETPNQSVSNSNSPSPATNQSSTRQNVKVVVRVRPSNAVEMTRGDTEVWEVKNDLRRVGLQADYCERHRKQMAEYFFDEAFTGSDNKILFEKGVRDTIRSTMEGYNGTVFAYGQTSSDDGTNSQPGVIPQAVDCVFDYIKECQEKEFLLRVSYMEIYNETVRDLLSPETEDLRIHEDKRRGVYVSPLKEVVVSTPRQVLKEIMKGEANRHMSATDWNERSSRSHTIFQMVIESTAKNSSPSTSHRYHPAGPKMSGASVSLSVLNLIDLAGSEKATTSIDRRKEGAYINKSLLTLGTVISKLTENSSGGHIPFRDSKLTRILQNSLSGNARVSVICTISPSVINIEESQNTLKFAARVKKVVTKAHTNAVMDDKALLQKYRLEIEELKTKLESTNISNDKEKEAELSQMLAQEKAKHEEQMMEAQLVRTALKERIDHLTKLILNNSSFSGSPANALGRKVLVEPSGVDQFEKQIADLRSELNSKNKIIGQLTAEKRNELQRTKELEIIIEQQQERIQLLENDGRGHSRSGSGRDFSNSPEYSDLSKTIQRQRDMIKDLQEDIKSKEKIIAKQNEMMHLVGLSQFESKSANKINGHHIENGTYRADEIKLTNIDEITNSDDNRGNDRNDVLLKNNCLIISDEAILIFLLFTFSNFITVG
ncbi:tubulin-dependent ATPase KIP3 [Rhizophagus irregularis DAOM 197198w]|uniref:Kinesin-like protein n=1 Tax=Rhizophagus irregularis (strain DAOM 197198w) TaxID=1432141 RepID=A0A015K7I4_RHIIW|nr:tubulin-dependent ATPase KIP3 [Rhizophagus irregularis DAOM 197198w]